MAITDGLVVGFSGGTQHDRADEKRNENHADRYLPRIGGRLVMVDSALRLGAGTGLRRATSSALAFVCASKLRFCSDAQPTTESARPKAIIFLNMKSEPFKR
jgi:hypothetical protein